ncbi:MAG: hypothetical protein N0E48_19235 [Candidatus Thiodiazotropha endolucinida]|nr:hypothetical protein [Candidatus Thiodiazotropha taylori]MCW4345471.1 hypothetical protein [Candidatus Thiodiazotropha endolucinida]
MLRRLTVDVLCGGPGWRLSFGRTSLVTSRLGRGYLIGDLRGVGSASTTLLLLGR